MTRREFLSLFPAAACFPLLAAEPQRLTLENAIRSGFSKATTPKVFAQLAVTTEPEHRMHWTTDRTQVQRTIDCFKEWADLAVRKLKVTGFLLTVGDCRYSVDQQLLCTPLEK